MSYTLRPYQRDCIEAARKHLAFDSSTLASLPTGTGKTVIFSHMAAGWQEGRVLVLAHREELIAQAADKVHAAVGWPPEIEMAQNRAGTHGKVVLASVQTISRPKRLERFNPEKFGLVIIDEAHHAIANSYRSVLDHFKQNTACKVLGVTATPKRADGFAMGQVFDSVCYEYSIWDAVQDGWLVNVNQQAVKVDELDFSKVRTLAGDFNEAELEAILTQETPLHRVAKPTVELSGDRSALIFCVTVNHAKLMAEVLNRYKKGSAQWLSGETDSRERQLWVERFRRGEIQFLCNCGLFLEGFDAPCTAVVVMARPTKSIVLYTQVLGRGTRPLPGVVDGLATAEERRAAILASGKPAMLALDFVGNAGKHKIVTAVDVLGGKYGAPAREYAKQTSEEEGVQANVDEALDRAQAELELLQEEEERKAKLAPVKAEAAYRTYGVSPFGGTRAARTADSEQSPKGEPATDKQIWKLRSLGVSAEMAKGYSKRQASVVIDKLLKSRGANV